MCLSIFSNSRYFLKSLRRTRCLRIQTTFSGILAFALPFRFPCPICLPFNLAAARTCTRNLDGAFSGFLITSPSLTSFLTDALVLAPDISVISLGSNQTFLFPHFITAAASRFCNLNPDVIRD
eukprot:NODE_815_length_3734_cov_0.660523.p5 type:complete len:123 gc:universal NODE_815_length_3734_cov_0.660523:567-935(+)